jgi:hypothetical protein
MVPSPIQWFGLRNNEEDIHPGAQTERRGGAVPVGGKLWR